LKHILAAVITTAVVTSSSIFYVGTGFPTSMKAGWETQQTLSGLGRRKILNNTNKGTQSNFILATPHSLPKEPIAAVVDKGSPNKASPAAKVTSDLNKIEADAVIAAALESRHAGCRYERYHLINSLKS